MWRVIVPFIAGLLLLTWGSEARAGERPLLYFETAQTRVGVGGEFSVVVYTDSPVALNAFDIEIQYPSALLELVRVNNARSVIDVWPQPPAVLPGGIVKVAGGAFKPFEGERGEIIELIFTALAGGDAQLNFPKANLYLADGKGTLVATDARPLALTIDSATAARTLLASDDTKPPIISSLEIIKSPLADTLLLSFSARDYESGMGAALLRERKRFTWSEWRPVLNPAPIEEDSWAVELKVLDNEYNAATRTVYRWNVFVQKVVTVMLMTAVLLAGFFVLRLVYQSRRSSPRTAG